MTPLPQEVERIILDWMSGQGELLHFWEERVQNYYTYYIIWRVKQLKSDRTYFLRVFGSGDKWDLSQDACK